MSRENDVANIIIPGQYTYLKKMYVIKYIYIYIKRRSLYAVELKTDLLSSNKI